VHLIGGLRRTVLVLIFVMGLSAVTASAATLTVTATTDSITANDGTCSLREAVAAVDAPGTPGDCGTASADANTIVLGAHTYTLSISPTFTPPDSDDVRSGDLNVTALAGPLTISGAGAASTTVSATGLGDRILDIAAGANVVVSGLKLTGGHAPDGAAGPEIFGGASGEPGDAGGAGGAIRNAGTLAVTNATIAANAAGHGGNGGGITQILGGAGGIGGDGGAGGGIYNANSGTLSLSAVTLTLNQAGTGGDGGPGAGGGGTGGNGGCCGDGGALANAGGSVAIAASTISGNQAGAGGAGGRGGPKQSGVAGPGGTGAGGSSGGGISSVGGSISITNSTISSNLTGVGGAGGQGGFGTGVPGGVGGGAGNGSAGGGVRVASGLGALVNVTVYANQVGGPGTPGPGGFGSATGAAGGTGQPAFGGGVYDDGPPATSLTGTLLAANMLGNCSGVGVTLEDGGHNLSFGDASCPASFATGDPHLGVLQDNGGPTQTIALGPGSAAIDQIPATGAGCPATDQRGAPRPGGASCDIGAYEIAPPSVSVTAATELSSTGATLNGSATANAVTGNTHFEYGLDTAYGSQTAVQPIDGAAAVALSEPLIGLTPNTIYHYRLIATSGDGTTASPDATFATPPLALVHRPPLVVTPKPEPELTKLKIAPTGFLAAPATHKHKTGATISYTDSLAAKTTFVVLRATAGIKHGNRCVKKPKHSHGTTCTLYVKFGSFLHSDKAGTNTLHFTGRVDGHKLTPGRYRLQATPKIDTGAGATVTISFRIT
jgi:hypothetical protein